MFARPAVRGAGVSRPACPVGGRERPQRQPGGQRRPRGAVRGASRARSSQGVVFWAPGVRGAGPGPRATAGVRQVPGDRRGAGELTLGPPGWMDSATPDGCVENPRRVCRTGVRGHQPVWRPFTGALRGLTGLIRAPGSVLRAGEGARSRGRPQTGGTGLGRAARPLPLSPLPSSGQQWLLAKQQTVRG